MILAMKELISTFLLDDPENSLPMDRQEFYQEQIAAYKKTGKPTRACELVIVFLFNLHQDLLIQKRSFSKGHNPGLLDKSIGGHIRYGDSPEYTVMLETIQELQTPSVVLRDMVDFKKTLKLLTDYLSTVALLKYSGCQIYFFDKIINNERIQIANKTHAYLGIYEGRVRPVDREAQGVLFYSFDELTSELAKSPQNFTSELPVYVNKLQSEIEIFLTLPGFMPARHD